MLNIKKLMALAALPACIASAAAYNATSEPLVITGSMMSPVSSGTATTVNGTGSAWSLNVTDAGWSEGYAYTTFEIAPYTQVRISGGTLCNTITGSWYWGDLVIFALSVDPESAIAGKVAGPAASTPAPGVMAWMSDAQYGDPANYANKAEANSAGFRYFGGYDGFGSYRDAIGGYSANVENFRDGGLAINGGAYAGWNEDSATSMASGAPARQLAEILYPAGGGKNRALKDQTYAFDGTVFAGASGAFVTIMVRGGGKGGGAISVDGLTVSFSEQDATVSESAALDTRSFYADAMADDGNLDARSYTDAWSLAYKLNTKKIIGSMVVIR